MHRGDDYVGFKEEIADCLIKRAGRIIPSLANHIVVEEIGTPLSNEHNTLNDEGAAYGIAKTPNQVGRKGLSVVTPVRNLYLTGASTISHGVAGTMVSGLFTADAIVGGGLVKKVFSGQ